MPPPRPCPDNHKYCPDCGECRPLTEFYRVRAAAYPSGYRYGAYCKRHQYERMHRQRLAAGADSTIRETKRRLDRAYYARHKDNPAWRKQRNAAWRAFRERNLERVAASYRAWVERNPERRRASQRAWAQRQSLRRLGQRPPRDPMLDQVREEIAERDRDLEKDE